MKNEIINLKWHKPKYKNAKEKKRVYPEYISRAKSTQFLGISFHKFDKLLKRGLISPYEINGKKLYKRTDIINISRLINLKSI